MQLVFAVARGVRWVWSSPHGRVTAWEGRPAPRVHRGDGTGDPSGESTGSSAGCRGAARARQSSRGGYLGNESPLRCSSGLVLFCCLSEADVAAERKFS